MKRAIGKFLIFTVALLAFAGLVALTATRWYERWATTLPDFLPTEEQFVALVMYFARGPSGEEDPLDCGTYGPQEDPSAGLLCARDALEARRPFYVFYAHSGWEDGFARQALVSSGGGTYRFDYFMNARRVPPFSAIYQSLCRDPRFVQEISRAFLQCGPWPTSQEFWDEVRVGKECGYHSTMSDISSRMTREQVECVLDALESREAFHFGFDTDWGGARGIVDGALFWRPDEEPAPVLSYYLRDDQSDDAQPRLIQRSCETPRLRLVPVTTTSAGPYRRSSIEVDCGPPSLPPR